MYICKCMCVILSNAFTKEKRMKKRLQTCNRYYVHMQREMLLLPHIIPNQRDAA